MTLQELRRTGRTTRMVEAALRWCTELPAGGSPEPRRTARLLFCSGDECRAAIRTIRALRPQVCMTIEEGARSQDAVLTAHISEYPLFGAGSMPLTRVADMKLYKYDRVMDLEALHRARVRLKPGLDWPENSVFIDHYVYEYLMGSLLEDYHRYDVSGSPTGVPEVTQHPEPASEQSRDPGMVPILRNGSLVGRLEVQSSRLPRGTTISGITLHTSGVPFVPEQAVQAFLHINQPSMEITFSEALDMSVRSISVIPQGGETYSGLPDSSPTVEPSQGSTDSRLKLRGIRFANVRVQCADES